ncbi:sodium/nucleoside cotransporter 1-like [Toxorhynchites rutilus septentrionalis]|uniref:sodium/nucleoside cotransporter 1-like n=1 Tax=Toxorhynchites rutilus septentrionalis TaxID=329112 RepID=UPI00247900E6|nr:sodium/nucleoside cotransporter 1-like [Toxorhynchites rutilus septentrionalis]XP_055631868.1 sodium/nucleoside cotransporter 1-like [Toxorhynchites rutilus septentrionalis]XP_055631869.1 sodium/nucleoside cotransporter 1-like [Toxorhynchites rutilus septentrionalis]XP_055631870.1 sodium/nucleoside cotransporter 1-like [Toxorhynchites rutilus septentrionalis]
MSGIQNEAFDHDGNGIQLSHRKSGTIINTETPDSFHSAISQPAANKPGETMLSKIQDQLERHRPHIRIAWLVALNVAVIIFFGFATNHYLEKEKTCLKNCGMQWCDGYGMLILLLGFIYCGLVYYNIVKPLLGKPFKQSIVRPLRTSVRRTFESLYSKLAAIGVVLVGFAIFCFFETRDEPERLMSLIGMVILFLISFLCCKHPTKINYRPVVLGVIFQFLLGLFCIRWEVGRSIFTCFGDKVATFLNYSKAGASFVYGDFIVNQEAVFGFAVLSVIYFFSFFISILYYLGAMQWVVMKLGWILQTILGSTVCESVIAAANIFLGMSESPLLIRPYIKDLTLSEIHMIMASGFATVSGTVLAAYISFGAEPAHLITASVMAAPAAICFAKLIYPETEESKTRSDNIQMEKSTDSSLLDAASNGANTATALVLGIIANLIAFVSFIAFLNGLLDWLGTLVGLKNTSLEDIFGTIFRPLAFVLGVPWDESFYVGKLIGTKTIINEFVAYQRLGEFIKAEVISPRSSAIATYAICGFANPSSMGIMIGTLSAMVPEKRGAITSVAFRAFITGSIVCFMTASIGGLLMDASIFNNMGGSNALNTLSTTIGG